MKMDGVRIQGVVKNLDGVRFNRLVRGASAYEVAVRNGFEGTEAEWIASLEDRAKHYADESEQWADDAASARSGAIDAASTAETHSNKAKVSEDNAKQSETNAEASAAKAKASENNATEMAGLAGRAKGEAEGYSAQAANSAQEAAAVKEYVDASVATAAKHAAAAKASEDVAKESGETATAKAAEIESCVSDAELAALNSAASANKSETFSKQSHQRYVDAANEANEAHSHMIGARDARDEAINMYGMTSDLHTSVKAHADVVATQRNESLEFMIAAETHARNASKSAQEAKEAAQKAGGVKTVNGQGPDENGNVQIETGGGSGAPADWNAAEGEPGHVLNRTHWVDPPGESESVLSETVAFASVMTASSAEPRFTIVPSVLTPIKLSPITKTLPLLSAAVYTASIPLRDSVANHFVNLTSVVPRASLQLSCRICSGVLTSTLPPFAIVNAWREALTASL